LSKIASMRIRPPRSWVVLGWVAAGFWLGFLVLVLVASWTGFDWSGRAVVLFLLAVSAVFIFAIARSWRSLDIRADDKTVCLGKRTIPRREIASIAVEPPGDTRLRFWAAAGVMAVTQDAARMVVFRSADRRALLETKELYGREQLRELANFLDVPLVGY
jgi:hypothetical protein